MDTEAPGRLYRPDADELYAITDRRYRGRLRRGRGGSLIFEDATFRATIAPDGALSFVDRANLRGGDAPLEIAKFDLTDAAMRARGEDPYGYEKRRFARATAGLRAQLRRRHLARVGKRALEQGLPRRLRRLWLRHRRRAPARLRRLVFELWDECGERGRAVARVARLGLRARRTILRFIRDHLPADDPRLAYTPGELRRLNQRRSSRARFVPYPRRRLGRAGRLSER